MPSDRRLQISLYDKENFSVWGETDPDFLMKIFVDFLEGRYRFQFSREQVDVETLHALSWRHSFEVLFSALTSVSRSDLHIG